MWKTSSPFFREVFPLLLKQSMSVSRYYKKSPAKSPHRKTDKKNKSSPILGHCTKRHQTITDGTTITTKLFKHSKHDLAGNPTHIAARLKKSRKITYSDENDLFSRKISIDK